MPVATYHSHKAVEKNQNSYVINHLLAVCP